MYFTNKDGDEKAIKCNDLPAGNCKVLGAEKAMNW